MSSANSNLKNLDFNKIPSAKGLKFGIVVSKWNSKITDKLLDGCLDLLKTKFQILVVHSSTLARRFRDSQVHLSALARRFKGLQQC